MTHRLVNPPGLSPPTGFSHAVVAAPGRTVFLGGQTAQLPDGSIAGDTLPEQFDRALANLVAVLGAVGAVPEHLVTLTVYAVDGDDYRAGLSELGRVYRRHLGKHYPAMAFFQVAGLFDPAAKVEVVGTAVIPE